MEDERGAASVPLVWSDPFSSRFCLARSWRLVSAAGGQQGGLTGTGRAEEINGFPATNGQANPINRGKVVEQHCYVGGRQRGKKVSSHATPFRTIVVSAGFQVADAKVKRFKHDPVGQGYHGPDFSPGVGARHDLPASGTFAA